MKTRLFPALLCVLLTAAYAAAQNSAPPLPSPAVQPPAPSDAAQPPMPPLPEPSAVQAPVSVPVVPPAPGAQPPLQSAPVPAPTGTMVDPNASATPAPAGPVAPASPTAPVSTLPPLAKVGSEPPNPQNLIRVNFQNASLTDVLNYLSDAAGFIIVEETPVSGTVNVVSRHPINAEEAVDLLNSVLYEKGYTAVRNGRILKIVSSQNAQTHDLPVKVGADPEAIPRNDAKVTQILTIRYMDAAKLVDNLRPLLSTDAAISSNESSNAIILTDTQANIHRMAEIIHALDTSISSISTIKVFPLRYADAKDFANVLTQLFSPDQSSSSNNRQGQPQVPAFFARFAGGGGGGGGGRGGGGGGNEPESEARKAASRVVAVPDEQSNSVVVSAPDEYMATIADIVSRLDTSTTDVTETRIFRLEHADSVELSNIINSLYGDPSTVTPNGNRTGQQNQQNGRPNNNNNNPRQQAATTGANGQPSERSLLEARVIAVPDPRTNTIIVNSSHETMEQIALTIGRLDSTDSKKQHVYVHVLEHADPDNVATILRSMFGDTASTSTTSSQPTSSLLNQRTTTGASSSVTGTLNTGGSGSGGSGGGGSRNGGGFQ